MQGLYTRLKAFDLVLNNAFRALGFLLSSLNMGGDRLLQIIDVVDENSVQLVHLGIDIARHRDIYEEHGAIPATTEKQLPMLALEDGHRRSGGSNNDVRSFTMLVQIVEANRAPAEPFRHGLRPIVGAVGDKYRSRAASDQMPR